ncbi:JAB domain-containing protein [Petrocella sp. FN5]|uniref:JAB domain-containing protein n=1 Tax=Petrocella sp. FN5 TaxID=3032002 RepID=UPI0023DAB5CF|nr:JAB domain-containing protein [Petrocella sp. FN5]MDF1618251.1 JAB domain-containing protein [Petrocella sp. FN5]
MATKQVYTDSFFESLNKLTGIPMRKIKDYAKENNPFNILEHPMVVEPNDRQLEKIGKLKEFLASYNVLKMTQENERIKFTSPQDAGKYFTSILGGMKDKERILVAFLDNSNSIIETKIISEGGINMSIVYPRDILKMAIANDCSNILMAHNHPGGSTNPSKEDIDLTQRIVNIFKPLDINVIDHIIIGGYSFSSMAENGILPSKSMDLANYQPITLPEIKEASYAYKRPEDVLSIEEEMEL